MVLLLVAGLTVLWWEVSAPAGGRQEAPASAPPAGGGLPSVEGAPGNLRPGQAWFGGLAMRATTVVTAESVLRDVRIVGQDVVATPAGVVGGRVAAQATVPFRVVAEALGPGTVVRAAGGEQATVIRDVEVLGREVRVVATGTVEVRDGRLVLQPRSVDIGGPGFLSEAIGALARRLVTVEHDIEGLPQGLALRGVVVQRDGFRARLRGDHVALVP
jgi:hypothetical protein